MDEIEFEFNNFAVIIDQIDSLNVCLIRPEFRGRYFQLIRADELAY